MKLITEKSPQYMQCVLNEFKLVSGGHDILDVMKDECPKDFFLSVKTYGKYNGLTCKYVKCFSVKRKPAEEYK